MGKIPLLCRTPNLSEDLNCPVFPFVDVDVDVHVVVDVDGFLGKIRKS